MFGQSMKMFEDDPFFSGFSPPKYPSLMPSLFERRDSSDQEGKRRSVTKSRDPFESMMENMNRMMNDLHSHMNDVEGSANGHCFTASTVMSYQNDGKSAPKYMQASTSTRKAPGEIKETRRTYRDSESGVEKMAIGHHIGRRGHEIEKRRVRGGDLEEERRFYELDESDLPDFEGEWRKKTSESYNVLPSRRPNRIDDGRRESRGRNSGAIERRPIGPSKSGRQRH